MTNYVCVRSSFECVSIISYDINQQLLILNVHVFNVLIVEIFWCAKHVTQFKLVTKSNNQLTLKLTCVPLCLYPTLTVLNWSCSYLIFTSRYALVKIKANVEN